MSSVSAPIREKQRIQIIDSVRGIALLGILLMNIPYFANPEGYGFNLQGRNEYSGINYYVWWIVEAGFSGSMRGLFSILFGAGTLLLLNRLEKSSDGTKAADIYYRRILWLLVFGLINAFIFLWPGDILYGYALAGLILFPFRKLKAKHLFYCAMAALIFSTAQGTYRLYQAKQVRVEGVQALALEKQKVKLSETQEEAKKKWLGRQEKTKPENIRKEADKEVQKIGGQGYFGVFSYFVPINAEIESTRQYDSYFFDVVLFVFLGMALLKWYVVTCQRSKKFYWMLLLCTLPFGLAMSIWEHSIIVKTRFDYTVWLDRIGIFVVQLRRLFVTLGYLSIIMLLYKYRVAKRVLNAMARVGQMAFTNYLSQSIICAFIFYGFGFGLFGKLQRYEQYYVVGAIWIFQIAFSNIWLHYYRFGPFEWVWRSLTYWKRQPFKRVVVSEEPEEDKGGELTPALA